MAVAAGFVLLAPALAANGPMVNMGGNGNVNANANGHGASAHGEGSGNIAASVGGAGVTGNGAGSVGADLGGVTGSLPALPADVPAELPVDVPVDVSDVSGGQASGTAALTSGGLEGATHGVLEGSAGAGDASIGARHGVLVDNGKVEDNTHLTADQGDNHVGVFKGVDICDPQENADVALHGQGNGDVGPLQSGGKDTLKASALDGCDVY
ncbi:MAG: hypothetical protein LC624_02265 [Halobacteriales archaeon]|nr:hypothetical protein [Halobacteriales archaeon]